MDHLPRARYEEVRITPDKRDLYYSKRLAEEYRVYHPLLDMVRYQKFLLGKLWVPEYGSSDDAKQFQVLYQYSPYHHVRKGVKYPAVLFLTGDSDTRVAPLHARKMTALVQASTGSDRPVLLRYDTKAGHSAGLPVTKQVEEFTDVFSFLLAEVGTS